MTLSNAGSLDSKTSGTTNTTITSNAFVPAANALLVAFFCVAGNQASMLITGTTLVGVGAWTDVGHIYTGSATIACAYAQVRGQSPSGTITATWGTTGTGINLHVLQFTGHQIGAPVRQTKVGTASTSGTTYSQSFGSTCLATSAVLAGISAVDSTGISPGSGFTELYDTVVNTSAAMETEYDRTSAAQAFAWGGLSNGSARAGLAIEVAEDVFRPRAVFM